MIDQKLGRRIEQIRKAREELDVIQQDFISQVNAMTPEERNNFMVWLDNEMNKAVERKALLEEKGAKISKYPITKKMKDWQTAMWLLSHGITGTTLGCILGASQCPEYIGGMMLSGALIGGVMGMANAGCWEEKPLTNAANILKKYINDKKIKELDARLEVGNIIKGSIAEMSAQGDYEDAEAYSNY